MTQRREFIVGFAATAGATSSLRSLASQPGAQILANTVYGPLRGQQERTVCVFRGVPYGATTEGARRWLPPQPPTKWSDVRDAFEYGEMAPQSVATLLTSATHARPDMEMPQKGPMGEDCLKLHLWTPAVGRHSGRRPVMVWLHGGAFRNGSGGALATDGTHLAARQDIVVVTVTHRLNVLGFLELGGLFGPDYAGSGNVGLLDCVAALRWVKDNIAQFGGDPANVTLFGQSGGASKVCCLMAMPAAHGLFHRAIAQSTPVIQMASHQQAAQAATHLLATLQVSTLEALQAMPASQLLAGMMASRFDAGPNVDGMILPDQPFGPRTRALSAHVPLITGSTETEATFFAGSPLGDVAIEPIDAPTLHAKVSKNMRLGDADVDRLIAAFRAQYPSKDDAYLYQLMFSQWMFTNVSDALADLQSADGAPVYQYYFDEHIEVENGRWHSPHTLDIGYVFDNIDRIPALSPIRPAQRRLADLMSASWAAFARAGNPNHRDLPRWKRFDSQRRAVMRFGDQVGSQYDPLRETRLLIAELKHAGGV